MSTTLDYLLKRKRAEILQAEQQVKAAQQALDNHPAQSPAKTVYDHDQWLAKRQALENALKQAQTTLRHLQMEMSDLERQDQQRRQLSIF